nr:MAG TPA: hypothetical protein [Caudoviricetes sp.]
MFKKIKDIAKTDALWLAVITTGIATGINTVAIVLLAINGQS